MKLKTVSLKVFAQFTLCLWLLMFAVQIANIGRVPFKALIALVFMIAAIILLMATKRNLVMCRPWLIYFNFAGISVCFVMGLFFNHYSAISHFFILLPSMLMVYFSFALYQNSILRDKEIERIIYLSAQLGICFKVLIVSLVLMGVFSADDINGVMESFLGSPGYDMSLYTGFMGIIPRIGDSGDVVYLIIFMFYSRRYSGQKVFYFWLLVLALVLISNSRYLFVLFLVLNLIAIYSADLTKIGRLLWAAVCIFSIVSFFYLFSESIGAYFIERYTGALSLDSDLQRAEQAVHLLSAFKDNPLLGRGMGGYIHDFVRNEGRMWHYELEYLAMLMQFGIIGFFLIPVCYSIWFTLSIFENYDDRFKLQVVLALCIWLATPFQSALFTGASGSFILISIFFLSRISASTKTSPVSS